MAIIPAIRETMRARKNLSRHVIPALLVFVLCIGWTVDAQENVTISKSRLQELEDKERELNRLKGDLTKTQDENARLKKEQDRVTSAPPAPAPVVVHRAAPMSSLPALKETDAVDAMDLADHYRV